MKHASLKTWVPVELVWVPGGPFFTSRNCAKQDHGFYMSPVRTMQVGASGGMHFPLEVHFAQNVEVHFAQNGPCEPKTAGG